MASAPFPGAVSPTAGFDQPFELLSACHDRVRQRLDLLGRLIAHLQQQGADASARSAADDILRYFDVAAPQHHDDEERHLVPVLLASDDAACRAAAQRLLDDHVAIRASWATLRPLLRQLDTNDLPALSSAAKHFISLHGPHLQLEDDLVYPEAAARLPALMQAAMGQEMAHRRGAVTPRD